MTDRFPAWRFDGRSGQPHAVEVRVEADTLVVESQDSREPLRMPLDAIEISEPFDHAPRVVYLRSGETIQVTDGHGISRALEAAGAGASLVAGLQTRPAAVATALLALLGGFVFAYVSGVPALARWAAEVIPPAVKQRMGDRVLEFIDARWLEASELPEETRETIGARFADAAMPHAADHPVRLEFRRMQDDDADDPDDGVNAFSLPNGAIVVLDGLVEGADPDQVFAVLGHEMGHVVGSHSMRTLVRAAGVGGLAALAWGDFSGIAASVPVALGGLSYSRDLELEADDFAVRFLRVNGLDARPLCRFFQRIIHIQEKVGLDRFPEFISTHPDTPERLERLCPDGTEGA